MTVEMTWALIVGVVLGAALFAVMLSLKNPEDGVLKSLKGYRTYIIAALGIAIFGAEQVGLIPPGSSNKIDIALGMLGLATLRAAVQNAKSGE